MKTDWIRLANMKRHFKMKSVPPSPPTGLPSLKWKTVGKHCENMGRPWKTDEIWWASINSYQHLATSSYNLWGSLGVAYPSKQPQIASIPQGSQVSRWLFGASGPAAPWVGALMEGCSTSWGSTGYRIIWIDWAILGTSRPFFGHYWPLNATHIHSLSLPSHSLITSEYSISMHL